MKKNNSKWLEKQTYSKKFQTIKAKKFHDINDFVLDNGCYVLIRTYKKTKEIGVAICNYKHEIMVQFKGNRPQDIYNTIFSYSKKKRKGWFQRHEHAAYLGKELTKAEICLKNKLDYVQE